MVEERTPATDRSIIYASRNPVIFKIGIKKRKRMKYNIEKTPREVKKPIKTTKGVTRTSGRTYKRRRSLERWAAI